MRLDIAQLLNVRMNGNIKDPRGMEVKNSYRSIYVVYLQDRL